MRRWIPIGALGLPLALAVAFPAGAGAGPRPSSPPPCDGPGADAWVTRLRDGVLSSDLLARHAVDRFGAPVRCDGEVTTVSDGVEFGRLRLDFEGGAWFEVETRPPETSAVALRIPAGFGNEAEARRLLADYCAAIGVHIDWETPTTSEEGGERTTTWADPEEGLNAKASLVHGDGRLVELRFSLAL